MEIARGVLLLLLATALTPAQGAGQQPTATPPANEWRTVYGGPREAVHAAAAQPGDYIRLRGLVGLSRWDAKPPAADFSRQIVVAICLGSRPTGGYRVNFLSAEKEGERLVVRYEEVRPGPFTFVTQALTSPCLMKLLPRPEGLERKVIFERTSRQWFPNDLDRERSR